MCEKGEWEKKKVDWEWEIRMFGKLYNVMFRPWYQCMLRPKDPIPNQKWLDYHLNEKLFIIFQKFFLLYCLKIGIQDHGFHFGTFWKLAISIMGHAGLATIGIAFQSRLQGPLAHSALERWPLPLYKKPYLGMHRAFRSASHQHAGYPPIPTTQFQFAGYLQRPYIIETMHSYTLPM